MRVLRCQHCRRRFAYRGDQLVSWCDCPHCGGINPTRDITPEDAERPPRAIEDPRCQE